MDACAGPRLPTHSAAVLRERQQLLVVMALRPAFVFGELIFITRDARDDVFGGPLGKSAILFTSSLI